MISTEVVTYFVDPSTFKKKEESNKIQWTHDHYMRELSDGDLSAFLLCATFEEKNYVTDNAKRLAQFGKLRNRTLSLSERGCMTRALREYPLVGMTGTDFLAYAKELNIEKERERNERLQYI